MSVRARSRSMNPTCVPARSTSSGAPTWQDVAALHVVHGSRGSSSGAALQRLEVDAAGLRAVPELAHASGRCIARLVVTTTKAVHGTTSRPGSSTSGPMSRSAPGNAARRAETDEAIALADRQGRIELQQLRPDAPRAARTAGRRRSAIRAPPPWRRPPTDSRRDRRGRRSARRTRLRRRRLLPRSCASSAFASRWRSARMQLRTEP